MAQIHDAEVRSMFRASRRAIQERAYEHQIEVREEFAIENNSFTSAFHGVHNDSVQLLASPDRYII